MSDILMFLGFVLALVLTVLCLAFTHPTGFYLVIEPDPFSDEALDELEREDLEYHDEDLDDLENENEDPYPEDMQLG